MSTRDAQRRRSAVRQIRNGVPAFVLVLGLGVAPAHADEPRPASNERRAQLSALRAHTREARQVRLERRKRAARSKMLKSWQKRARRAVRFAMRQRGKPYVWGGTGPRGYDCSGLTWRSWRKAGIRLPRTAREQYRRLRSRGRYVPRRSLRPGDLIFFRGLRHVGMYVGKGRFVHAPRRGVPIGVRRLKGYYGRAFVGGVRPGWARDRLGPPSRGPRGASTAERAAGRRV